MSVYQCKLQASISLCQWMEAYAHERQFVIMYAVCQNGIPALLDSWVKNTPSVCQNVSIIKKFFASYFHENITCCLYSFFSVMYNCVRQTLSCARYVAQHTTHVAAVVYTTMKSCKCGAAIVHNNIRGKKFELFFALTYFSPGGLFPECNDNIRGNKSD